MSLIAIPTLRINDIEIARQFYAKGLGFDVDWIWRATQHDESWGNREMQVRDPDGNYLRFCTPISRPG